MTFEEQLTKNSKDNLHGALGGDIKTEETTTNHSNSRDGVDISDRISHLYLKMWKDQLSYARLCQQYVQEDKKKGSGRGSKELL